MLNKLQHYELMNKIGKNIHREIRKWRKEYFLIDPIKTIGRKAFKEWTLKESNKFENFKHITLNDYIYLEHRWQTMIYNKLWQE